MSLVQDLRGSSKLGLLVAVAAATVGIIYGYDSSNIGAAIDFIAKDFHLSDAAKGSVTAFVVLGEIIGALAGGTLANRFGRKPVMVAVGATFTIFSLGSGLAWSVTSLEVARFLLGLTVGVSIVVVPMFVAESSATKIRGALLVLYQVATVVGIILGYLLAMALAGTGSWRLMLGAAAVPGVLITLLLLRLPDTPRWYMLNGRRADAERVLREIDRDADVPAELDRMAADAKEFSHGRSSLDGLKEMVRTPYLRATFFVVGLGFFVQITGINAIVYYSPQIFKAMGVNQTDYTQLFGLSALVQVAGLLAVFVSMSLVDKMGRRPVLLTGIAIMILANILLITVFQIGAHGQTDLAKVHLSGVWVALGFIGLVLFTAGFTFGFGALVWVYAGESFPSHLRGLGASTMLTADLIANYFVAKLFPSLLSATGGVGVFLIFGLFAAISFGFIYKFAPETKGRPLDDIREYWENGGAWPEQQTVTD